MGFTIFESSGTFNPSDYGLVAGDLIHIIAVGGGGGGCGTANIYTPGNPGGSSSFGNILTAAGGLSPSDQNPVTPTTGSFRGGVGVSKIVSLSGEYNCFGGCGADGWIPGVCKGRPGIMSTIVEQAIPTTNGTELIAQVQDNTGKIFNFGFGGALISAIPSGAQIAGTGGVYASSNVICVGGAGGFGYGAGGGGGSTYQISTSVTKLFGAGGNSGQIAQKDYVLSSVSSIAVTVGAGGAGGTGYAGGKGANGCVAIFW